MAAEIEPIPDEYRTGYDVLFACDEVIEIFSVLYRRYSHA